VGKQVGTHKAPTQKPYRFGGAKPAKLCGQRLGNLDDALQRPTLVERDRTIMLPTPSSHALLAFHQRAQEESRWPVDEVETGTSIDLALVYLRLMLAAAARPGCSGICLTTGRNATSQAVTIDALFETTPSSLRAYPVFRPPIGLETDGDALAALHRDAVALLLAALDAPTPSGMALPPSVAASTHHVILRPAHRPAVTARVSWDMGRPPSTPTYIRM
jgi:hypothetical protein